MDRSQRDWIDTRPVAKVEPALGLVLPCRSIIDLLNIFRLILLHENIKNNRCGLYEEVLGVVYVKKEALTIAYESWKLTRFIAPAASAVKYETQHFDLPPIAEGPFIGKGDDVDERWDQISASMSKYTE